MCDIKKKSQFERVEKNMIRWYGHVLIINKTREVKSVAEWIAGVIDCMEDPGVNGLNIIVWKIVGC